MQEKENFAYQVIDTMTGDFYGTKKGHPILKFLPPDSSASKGKDKHKPVMVYSRVFQLKKHRQRIGNNRRETTYSYGETNGTVIAIHLKGAW